MKKKKKKKKMGFSFRVGCILFFFFKKKCSHLKESKISLIHLQIAMQEFEFIIIYCLLGFVFVIP